MTTSLPSATVTRLEKAAVDNGFDGEQSSEGPWLAFTSTQCPLRIWLGTFGDAMYLVALSQLNVVRALAQYGVPISSPLPRAAVGGCTVSDIPALHRLLRRAFQLSKALPDELLHTFEKQTAGLPRSTEAERVVVQRVGQDIFRRGLLDYWEGRCAVTGLAVQPLLRASHIKPWADCDSDAERLDVFNGLLLSPHLDAAFDAGFVTLNDEGIVVVSSQLSMDDRVLLGLNVPLCAARLADGHRQYLPWHREAVFRSG